MGQGFRPEIQGLRAIAVLSVLLFHVWPVSMPGGYVGVDVFFVISGYLITGLLFREVGQTGRISLLEFYCRRIRRLLPAATAVLVAVAICLQFVSPVRWGETGEQIAASALYYQNWWLGLQAVDYLGAESAPGPLQHFWSLSIEEQYYILWPLAFWVVARLLSRGTVPGRTIFMALIAAVFATSLAYSIYLTPRNPGWAYFATTTRAWELALGGGFAVLPPAWRNRLPPVQMSLLALLGLLLIAFSSLVYSVRTEFPGYAALVPTIGTALVLFGTSGGKPTWVGRLLSTTPMQYMGDISYSLYLWHWPVVVYAYALLGTDGFSPIEGVIVVVVSFALAHFSKAMVEDRWRKMAMCGPQRWKTFALGAVCISLSLGATFWVFDRFVKVAMSVPVLASATGADQRLTSPGFRPSPMEAESDVGKAYGLRCITTTMGVDVHACRLAENPGGLNVVVVGDSHAASWLPTFEVLSRERGWNLTAVLKSACPFAVFPEEVKRELTIATMRTCVEWQSKAVPFVASLSPDLLVTAHSVSSMAKAETGTDSQVVANAIRAAWQQIQPTGAVIVAIADTPRFASKVPECLALNPGNAVRCGRSRAAAVPKRDPLKQAAALTHGVLVIDLNDRICTPLRCEAVIDGMIGWRDAHHMTRTFAESLADAMGAEVDALTGND